MAGASSGAIVAAFLASGRQETMTADWLAATGARVLRPEMILRGQWPWRMSDIVGEVLERAFGELRLPELPLPVAIPVTLIERGQRRRRVLTRDDDERLVDAVLGSCFVPGPYSTTVRVQGRVAFDGAWLLRTPVDAAFTLGATACWRCWVMPAAASKRAIPLARTFRFPRTRACSIRHQIWISAAMTRTVAGSGLRLRTGARR